MNKEENLESLIIACIWLIPTVAIFISWLLWYIFISEEDKKLPYKLDEGHLSSIFLFTIFWPLILIAAIVFIPIYLVCFTIPSFIKSLRIKIIKKLKC